LDLDGYAIVVSVFVLRRSVNSTGWFFSKYFSSAFDSYFVHYD